MALDQIDKRIIKRLQGDLPLTPRPFSGLAQELGLSEDEVVRRIKALAESGVMRRFGATLRHQQSGFKANVMVAWRVDPDQVDRVGAKLAAYRQVSHCYARVPCDDFPYNLYSMVHGRSEQECRELVARMAKEVGDPEHALLFSREELKKTSMKYY